MPQHWREQAVFWDMTGNYQCFAAACCHLHWTGRRLQHLRFLEWKWPAWYSEPCRMWHCWSKMAAWTSPEDTKILQNTPKYDTQHSQIKEPEDSSSSSWNLASKRWQMTITTHKWDTTNLLNIRIYKTLWTLVASCDSHKQHILSAGCCLVAWSSPEEK